jgi:predicted bacteriocin transport accessory protein
MFEKQLTMGNRKTYFENIKDVTLINAQEITEFTEDAYIYFGRVTCPYCREFAEEFPEAKVEIYYVDTENTDIDPELQKVRDEFGISTVPNLVFRKKDGSFTKLNREERQTIADFVSAQG